MSISSDSEKPSREEKHWARPVSSLKASQVPPGATNLNVEGRQVSGPLQGFGQLWKKTYRIRLAGCQNSPEEVMRIWKENFASYQPPANHFWATSTGVKPGEVIFIDSTLPTLPGGPGAIPLATGVMVMYEDETSFTVITPEGHPEAGWNTFSTYDEDGCTVAQVEGYGRAADPVYEFGLRFMGGARMQEETWHYVLSSLAKDLGVIGQVSMTKVCLDPSLQWSSAKNVKQNAALRTFFYKLGSPFRWAYQKIARKAR